MISTGRTPNFPSPLALDLDLDLCRRRKTLHSRMSAVVSSFLAVIAMQPALAGLVGSTVTGTGQFPDLSTIDSGPISGTVSSAVEFPFPGTLSSCCETVDITDTQLVLTAHGTVDYPAPPRRLTVMGSSSPVLRQLRMSVYMLQQLCRPRTSHLRATIFS